MSVPTTPTLAYKVETWAIDMLRTSALPGAMQILHKTDDPFGEAERVICAARVGDRFLEGCQPYAVELTITLVSTNRDAGRVEDYNRAIEQTFRTFPDVASKAAFAYLAPAPEGEDEKDNAAENRTRGRVYNFLALEA